VLEAIEVTAFILLMIMIYVGKKKGKWK